jgi:hypothetical protein
MLAIRRDARWGPDTAKRCESDAPLVLTDAVLTVDRIPTLPAKRCARREQVAKFVGGDGAQSVRHAIRVDLELVPQARKLGQVTQPDN